MVPNFTNYKGIYFLGRFWPSTKSPQVYGSMFSVEVVAHEEVANCYKSWELHLEKVGIFAHRYLTQRYKVRIILPKCLN